MVDTFLTNMAVADNAILGTLGETVTVKDDLNVSVGSVVGIFERQYVEAGDLQGYLPTFTYQDSALTIDQDYEITYLSQAYNVRVKQQDGTGIVFLILGEK